MEDTVQSNERWASIARTPVDGVLGEMGYDLTAEVREILEQSGLGRERPVLELATGTGRTIAVLTRMGHRALTGDLTLDELPTAKGRVGARYLPSVRFLRLLMEHLPFGDRSVPGVVSMTTIHELARPVPCVEEMVRVLAPGGVLVIADFNDAGFAALQHVHQTLHHRDHPRGFLPMADVAALLRRRALSVRDARTPLLTACIAARTPAASDRT
jgi:ubiquinone/menaquinone biosynthesis C-methylase UbiE